MPKSQYNRKKGSKSNKPLPKRKYGNYAKKKKWLQT